MSYKAVMTYIDVDGMPQHRVRIAASLADKLGAALIGMSAIPLPPPVVVDGVFAIAPTEDDVNLIRARLLDRAEAFRSVAGADRQKLERRFFLESPADALPREARAADIVVIGQVGQPEGAYGCLDPGKAILQMGRPTLVVPDSARSLQANHVVIGWKETREARRAVIDARPILEEAERVTIVELCDDGEEGTALERIDDVARYLTRHRINSGTKAIIKKKGTGSEQLIQFAQKNEADLLVTGAYGHSRLGEWVFGGMTRDLLRTSPLCCLMSH